MALKVLHLKLEYPDDMDPANVDARRSITSTRTLALIADIEHWANEMRPGDPLFSRTHNSLYDLGIAFLRCSDEEASQIEARWPGVKIYPDHRLAALARQTQEKAGA